MGKYFDATLGVSTERHPDALERVVGTPNKVHPPTLNTITHLWYTFRLRNLMTGTEIKEQSPWSQKRALVPKVVIDLYYGRMYLGARGADAKQKQKNRTSTCQNAERSFVNAQNTINSERET